VQHGVRPATLSFFLFAAVENLLPYILKVERDVFGTLKTPGELCARRHNLRKDMRRSVK
jgi:hypothetical protein